MDDEDDESELIAAVEESLKDQEATMLSPGHEDTDCPSDILKKFVSANLQSDNHSNIAFIRKSILLSRIFLRFPQLLLQVKREWMKVGQNVKSSTSSW